LIRDLVAQAKKDIREGSYLLDISIDLINTKTKNEALSPFSTQDMITQDFREFLTNQTIKVTDQGNNVEEVPEVKETLEDKSKKTTPDPNKRATGIRRNIMFKKVMNESLISLRKRKVRNTFRQSQSIDNPAKTDASTHITTNGTGNLNIMIY